MVIWAKGTWSFWITTIPLCREVGSGRDNGRHVRRHYRLEPKDVWMTQRLDTAPKLWMFSAPSGRHYVSALRRDVKLNFFFSLSQSGERGIRFLNWKCAVVLRER